MNSVHSHLTLHTIIMIGSFMCLLRHCQLWPQVHTEGPLQPLHQVQECGVTEKLYPAEMSWFNQTTKMLNPQISHPYQYFYFLYFFFMFKIEYVYLFSPQDDLKIYHFMMNMVMKIYGIYCNIIVFCFPCLIFVYIFFPNHWSLCYFCYNGVTHCLWSALSMH